MRPAATGVWESITAPYAWDCWLAIAQHFPGTMATRHKCEVMVPRQYPTQGNGFLPREGWKAEVELLRSGSGCCRFRRRGRGDSRGWIILMLAIARTGLPCAALTCGMPW